MRVCVCVYLSLLTGTPVLATSSRMRTPTNSPRNVSHKFHFNCVWKAPWQLPSHQLKWHQRVGHNRASNFQYELKCKNQEMRSDGQIPAISGKFIPGKIPVVPARASLEMLERGD